MDLVLKDLLKIEQRLELEVQQSPAYRQLHDVRRLIHQRRAMSHPASVPEIPPGRLLCEMVHEAYALHVWENEGGAVRCR